MNYLRPKSNLNNEQIQHLVSKLIKISRDNSQSFYFLSHKFEKNDKVWFKGFICTPNQLLQTSYWCDGVIPNKSIIVDFTESLNVPVLQGGVKVILNPNRIVSNNPKYLTKTYVENN
jgi:hypothetical protein